MKMKRKIVLAFYFAAFFFLSLFCMSCESVKVPDLNAIKQQCEISEAGKTEVVVIATIHQKHNINQSYSPEILRDLIIELNPKVILNELPKCYVWPNGSPMFPYKSLSVESWASSKAAKKIKAKQLPFDRADREAYWKKTRYWERFRENKTYISQLVSKNEDYRKYFDMQNKLTAEQQKINSQSGPDAINCSAYDDIVRKRYEILYTILPEIAANHEADSEYLQNLIFHANEWQERNTIMAGNIIKVAMNPEYAGSRIVVLTGADHKYILRDLLAYTDCVDLKEYWEVFDKDLKQ